MHCKHGLGKFCAICNKIVREIVQTAPPPKPRQVTIPKQNGKVDKPLFIGGSPFVQCGHCGVPMKKFGGEGMRFGVRDKYIKTDLERKIVVGKYLPSTEESYSVDAQGFTVVQRNTKKLLLSKPGCFECWNLQQRLKAQSPNKIVYFPM